MLAPLPCYGLEHDNEDAMCQACPHELGCIEDAGRRSKVIGVKDALFQIVPDSKRYKGADDPDVESIDDVYTASYLLVFSRHPQDTVTRWPKLTAHIIRVAKELQCSIRMAMTATMFGFKEANPDRVFYSNMMSGDKIASRVKLYRDACRAKFGHFDISALESLSGQKLETLEDEMLRSEVLFGKHVVGFKMRSGGDPFEPFYLMHEIELSPMWLAIEETYLKTILIKHLDGATSSKQKMRHRHAVSQAHGELKRSKQKARMAFYARDNIMTTAVDQVLQAHGMSPSHFETSVKQVSDIGRFWSKLGIAIQHFRCYEFLHGRHAALNALVLC